VALSWRRSGWVAMSQTLWSMHTADCPTRPTCTHWPPSSNHHQRMGDVPADRMRNDTHLKWNGKNLVVHPSLSWKRQLLQLISRQTHQNTNTFFLRWPIHPTERPFIPVNLWPLISGRIVADLVAQTNRRRPANRRPLTPS